MVEKLTIETTHLQWAMSLIKQRKAVAIIKRYVGLPCVVVPLLKLVQMTDVVVRVNTCERPSMTKVATCLEQIMRESLISKSHNNVK